jgi:hypothetical protein
MPNANPKVHLLFFLGLINISLIFSELTYFTVFEQVKLGRELLPE